MSGYQIPLQKDVQKTNWLCSPRLVDYITYACIHPTFSSKLYRREMPKINMCLWVITHLVLAQQLSFLET